MSYVPLFSCSDIDCVDMFSLPDHMMLDLASLLLSAAAVDREGKKVCVCVCMEER